MNKELVTFEDVWATAGSRSPYGSCHDPLALPEDLNVEGAETIVGVGDVVEGYEDSGSFALARLADGRFLVVREYSDSSGHGCRCSADASLHETFESAWTLGLTDSERHEAKELGKHERIPRA